MGANLTHLEAAGHSPARTGEPQLSVLCTTSLPLNMVLMSKKAVPGTSSSEEEHGPSCCTGTEWGAQLAGEREVKPWQACLPPLHFLSLLYNQFLLIQLIVCK